jgi:hypothetical protein
MMIGSTIWAAAVLILAGCTSEGPRVSEYLDPETAVTVRALAEPLLYAHAAPELAANARDYLSLGLVEVNNMGARKHYLALVSWTTINRERVGAEPAPVPERIEITISGHPHEFVPIGHESRSLGIGGALFRPPSGYVGESWYAMTTAEVRALAAAPPDSIGLPQQSGRVDYETWRGDRGSLAEFVRDIPDTTAAEVQRR